MTMERKLIMVISDGGGASALAGVHYDKENYLNFFKSPEGGAWMDNEILVFDKNNFSLNCLRELIKMSDIIGVHIDYILMVYCGHGFTDQFGHIQFQMQPSMNVQLDDILAITSNTRLLLIADSCRAVYPLREGGKLQRRAMLFSENNRQGQERYAKLCRDRYDYLISLTPSTIKTVLFADSYGETAAENKNGGIYSFALLKAAKETIMGFESLHNLNPQCYYEQSAIECHNIASKAVATQTHGAQTPEIVLACRSMAQLPFVVVPNWQLQLED
mgnify:CR=1 FL=1